MAQDIVDTVLNILREQQDSLGETKISDSIDLNPKSFDKGKHLIIGPIHFSTAYQSPPSVSFTQFGPAVDSDIRITSAASNYTPFLVHPYVYSWVWDSGVVGGFNVGLYALTDPRELGDAHKLVWEVSGKATRYMSPIAQEIWTSEDNSFQPDYLEDNN